MSDVIETTARIRMRTIIEGVVSDPTRVILGLDDIGALDFGGNFFDNLISCGPMIYILAAEQDNLDAVNRLYTFSIKVKIHYALVPDTDDEYKGINNFIRPVWQALLFKANYTDCLPPTSPNGFRKSSEVTHKSGVAGPVGVWEGTFVFISGIDC